MEEPKWTMERVHKEVLEARTKIFVVTKVLETGNLKFAENPEWALVVEPLLKDLLDNTAKIRELVRPKEQTKGHE